MSTPLSESSVAELTTLVRSFADSRDWQQFHTARNLVLALVGEAGELAAEFQWIGDDNIVSALQDADKREAVGSELADVFIYLLRLSDVIGIDLAEELKKKIAINEERYPADRAKGSAAKYTAYE
jgi:NTP pyrophosphatase (non-canonical NTP hydrolase)